MGTNVVPADAGSDRGVYDSLEALRSLLIEGERIEASAVQRRIFALRHRRIMVAATTGRLIIVQRGLFGGFTPIDLRWQDLRDATLSVGIFGATLRVAAYRSSDLASTEGPPSNVVIPGLRKLEAQEVYRACQTRAQAWREKRRIRELEELRAKAGGIQIGARPRASRRRPSAVPTKATARRWRAFSARKRCCKTVFSTTPNSNRSKPKSSPSYDANLSHVLSPVCSFATDRSSRLARHASAALATTLGAQTPDSASLAALRWRSIGPVNMAGRITDVEGDPKNPKTFYVTGATGGVWKTINAGTTFIPLWDHMPIASIGDIAIAPSDPKVIYVGTGEGNCAQQRRARAGACTSRPTAASPGNRSV